MSANADRRSCLADGGGECVMGDRCRRHAWWLMTMAEAAAPRTVGYIEAWRMGYLDGHMDGRLERIAEEAEATDG